MDIDYGRLLPQNEYQNSEGYGFRGKLPESLTMRMTLWYDNTLLAKFNGDHQKLRKALLAVVENTKKKYLQSPTLIIKINPLIESIRHINKNVIFSKNVLNELRKFDSETSVNCFFVENAPGQGEKGVMGRARYPMPCPKSNINQYGNIRQATNIFAHELGHNLDMT